MKNVRITKQISLDNPPRPYYVIQEVVTSTGLYIEWPEIFATRENAQKEVDRTFKVNA